MKVKVIGGGLAGSEAAWQVAQRGIDVDLYEMRPGKSTGAHVTGYLSELVCSNSLGSKLPDRAAGLLKTELKALGSLLLECAYQTAVPAGGALAVDRHAFAEEVTRHISEHPRIQLICEEVTEIPDEPAIIATGPLTSPALSAEIAKLTGREHLFFFDAISPIVEHDSINFEIAFRGSRYQRGDTEDGDYINCPFTRDEYYHFVEELVKARRIELKSFEKEVEQGVRTGIHHFFEGCLPVEIIARRGVDALAFGPMRPVGLIDPRTGNRPFAVVQLRRDNLSGSLYNLVGFQTNLTFSEQRRVFRLIPGLENAEFVRYGQMHRNTFIYSPAHLDPTLQWKSRPGLFFAGQITGVEGYGGNIATGLLAGVNTARLLKGQSLLELPTTTMLGSLCTYITHASEKDFQPMKANFGILPELNDKKIKGKRARARAYVDRAVEDLNKYLEDAKYFTHSLIINP